MRWLDGVTDSIDIWVWASSGSWWWTGKPGMLQSIRSQRVGHDWMTELNRYPLTGWLMSRSLLLTVLEVVKPIIRVLADLVSAIPTFWFLDDHLFAVTSHWGKGSLWGLFPNSTIPTPPQTPLLLIPSRWAWTHTLEGHKHLAQPPSELLTAPNLIIQPLFKGLQIFPGTNHKSASEVYESMFLLFEATPMHLEIVLLSEII